MLWLAVTAELDARAPGCPSSGSPLRPRTNAREDELSVCPGAGLVTVTDGHQAGRTPHPPSIQELAVRGLAVLTPHARTHARTHRYGSASPSQQLTLKLVQPFSDELFRELSSSVNGRVLRPPDPE
ncbi:hypothetical protein NUW54_g10696 [Trametes sanguinea]|uniref:Uncharacterized protein n=1 Tax=Trametes sanguinea TaxID=158606 RepID=A0ACC1NWL0_9APHY|nr:hypothetical protein NUW54_g10696 [Trametes sanguinea]